MKYTNKQIEKMKRSGKGRSIVTAQYLRCYQEFKKMNIPLDAKILDFGAGAKEPLTELLRHEGYTDITPFDLDSDESILQDTYEYTILSNVLNIQPDVISAMEIIALLDGITTYTIIWNYPQNPRYFSCGKKRLEKMINECTYKARNA